MTNKILVTVKVPMLEEEYDIYIPVSKNINTAIDLLVKSINELSGGHFPLKENCILLSNIGEKFNLDSTIKDCGIKNGDRLILI